MLPQSATTLHPRFQDPEVIHRLSEEWAQNRKLRILNALAPGLAEELADASLSLPFHFFQNHEADIRCVFWRQPHLFSSTKEADFPPIRRAQQLFQHDLPQLASAIAKHTLHNNHNDNLVFDCYTKGSYLDSHTDQAPDRLIAYVVGLTRDQWPPSQGGQLEFLAPDESTVLTQHSPAWGSIDMFCIYPLLRHHRVSLMQTSKIRLSVNGWLTGNLKGPKED